MNVKSLLAMGLLLGMLGALSLNAMDQGGQLVEAAGDVVDAAAGVLGDAGDKVDALLPGAPVSWSRKCWNGTKRTTKYGAGVGAAVAVPYVGYYYGPDAVRWTWRKGKEAAVELTDTNTKRVILGGLGLLAWQNRSLRKSMAAQDAARVIKDGERDEAIAKLLAGEVNKVTVAQAEAFAALELKVMGDQSEDALAAAAAEHALILQAAEGFEGQAEKLRVLSRWAQVHGKEKEWKKALEAGPGAEPGRVLSRVSSVASMSGLSEASEEVGQALDAAPVVQIVEQRKAKKDKKDKKKKKEAAPAEEVGALQDEAVPSDVLVVSAAPEEELQVVGQGSDHEEEGGMEQL